MPALKYGIWLAQVLNSKVDLLAVVESPDEKKSVTQLVDQAVALLEASGVAYQVHWDAGRGSLVIARYASQGDAITVVGPLGRPPLRRFIQGRSIRRIMAHISGPIIYVRKEYTQIQHMLLCMGGLGYAASMEALGLEIARAVGARVTLMHVVGPVNLAYPAAREVREHWEEILQTDTLLGRNLRNAMEKAQAAGVEADFIVRHGSVVNEITAETHSGKYDFIGLGSTYSAHSLRHLYMPNVTAEVAEVVKCPVLTMRQR